MPEPKKRLPAKERKKQILKCAVHVFAKANYRSTKMADIAAAAGISEAMIYKHFPSKKDIFLKILQHMSAQILNFWRAEAQDENDPLKLIKTMGTTYFNRMKNHPSELKVQFQAISEIDDKEIAAQLRQDHSNYIQFIETVLKKGVEQGVIRKDADTHALAYLFNGGGIVLNMMKLLELNDPFLEKNIDPLLDRFIETIRK